jgi:diadenosine tetraphosphate (Ap4A) HIT family hydrolase
MSEFQLHERLAKGSALLGRHLSCLILLKNHAEFTWFILVPEFPNITELHQLDMEDYERVLRCVREVAIGVEQHAAIDKLNIATIGNQVSQLHIHLIGRKTTDSLWPNVVWGNVTPLPCADAEWEQRQRDWKTWLSLDA